jgi:molybdopterin-guanine dinucleotide biosynthesis protein A
MGTDKALVDFGGQPLIARAVDILKSAAVPVFIAGASPGARPRLESYAPVVPDAEPGLGPLAGICAALRSTRAPLAVFLPVDVPLMPTSLIVYLLRHAWISGLPVTLASVNAFPQTFPAVVARDALDALESELAGGRLGCLAAFRAAALERGHTISAVPAEVLVQAGQVAHPQALPLLRWFLNINSADDLRLASLVGAGRVS